MSRSSEPQVRVLVFRLAPHYIILRKTSDLWLGVF
nr:MAG TPA: CRISPR-associated protein [Caudoviricetes sp.]